MIEEEENGVNRNKGGGMNDSPLYEEIFRAKERRSNMRFYASLLAILFVFALFRGVFTATFARIDVDGSSMLPTLQSGDSLLMQYSDSPENDGVPLRIKRTPRRGDVIIVDVRKYDFNNVDFLIKRLIGVGGDTVKEENGLIYIKKKGETEFFPLESQPNNVKYDLKGQIYEVGEGEIFFLGDNTARSMDSRYKSGQSHFTDRLYRAEDICGVVPQWAIDRRGLAKTFNMIFGRAAGG